MAWNSNERREMTHDEQWVKRSELRMDFAKSVLEGAGIRYIQTRENSLTVFGGKQRFTFFPTSGLIMGPYEERGIDEMVRIAKEREKTFTGR